MSVPADVGSSAESSKWHGENPTDVVTETDEETAQQDNQASPTIPSNLLTNDPPPSGVVHGGCSI